MYSWQTSAPVASSPSSSARSTAQVVLIMSVSSGFSLSPWTTWPIATSRMRKSYRRTPALSRKTWQPPTPLAPIQDRAGHDDSTYASGAAGHPRARSPDRTCMYVDAAPTCSRASHHAPSVRTLNTCFCEYYTERPTHVGARRSLKHAASRDQADPLHSTSRLPKKVAQPSAMS